MGASLTIRKVNSRPGEIAINYGELLQENPSHRIRFLGSPVLHFAHGTNVVVSFPGVHGKAWDFLTQESSLPGGSLRTSCIFLPDEHAEGYGEHAWTGSEGQLCHCAHLYGGKQAFGCAWYKLWVRKTLQARECNLIVVTKKDGSVGRSQKGEVSFLGLAGLVYTKMTIKEFVTFFAQDVPEEAQEVSLRMEKCRKARQSNCERIFMASRTGPQDEYHGEDLAMGLKQPNYRLHSLEL